MTSSTVVAMTSSERRMRISLKKDLKLVIVDLDIIKDNKLDRLFFY